MRLCIKLRMVVRVVERLIELGAWRTLQNTRGERPVDVAERFASAECHDHVAVGRPAAAIAHDRPSGGFAFKPASFGSKGGAGVEG
jgi:hypothetical protein